LKTDEENGSKIFAKKQKDLIITTRSPFDSLVLGRKCWAMMMMTMIGRDCSLEFDPHPVTYQMIQTKDFQ